jgi:predicted RNase H-like HicB family nuclease
MQYIVGIENNTEGRSMAWALEHPGCFSYGETGDRALAGLPEAIWKYAAWIRSHNYGRGWLEEGEIEFYLDGTWEVYAIDEAFNLAKQGYEVNAWYLHDWKPLTANDVECGLQILTWSREELLQATQDLNHSALAQGHPGERRSIAGIVKHVGGAEWWYLDRLGLVFPWAEVPADPFERIETVRAQLVKVLPELVGSKLVTGAGGEWWSPRKLLRRACWHERDHTEHILKLRQNSPPSERI